MKVVCGCKTVSYCSEECQEKDSEYHENRGCVYLNKFDVKSIKFKT